MWSNHFLDFIILEITEKSVDISGLLRNQDPIITTVYNFNLQWNQHRIKVHEKNRTISN